MWTADIYSRLVDLLSQARRHVHIIAPFVRANALSKLLENVHDVDVTIVTTWRTADLIAGVSDLDIFPYLSSRGWRLFLHPTLHAKVYAVDMDRAVVSSANVSLRALGLATPANRECATEVGTLGYEDRLWMYQLLDESTLVLDDYYEALRKHLAQQDEVATPIKAKEFDATEFLNRRHFLLSSLPMSESPDTLLSCIELLKEGKFSEVDPTERECALHDIALYSLDIFSGQDANRELLRAHFFAHPFIKAFIEFVGERKFFGESKAWVQNSCANVPVPRRRDLTGYVRTLFDWVVELGKGEFVVERPHHSECLQRVGIRP